jgi:hypothetical protein
MPDLDPTTNPDVQEALSRRYSDDIIMLLPLKSERIAVPPAAAPTLTKPPVDLEELDLI